MANDKEENKSPDKSKDKPEGSSEERSRYEDQRQPTSSQSPRHQDSQRRDDQRSSLLEGSYQPRPTPMARDERRYEWDDDVGRHPRPFPPNVGGADLDPFSRGGGMIMDPRDLINPLRDERFPGGGPRLPPGVPPGARFDPFGPPGVGPSPGRFSRDPRGGPAPQSFGEPNPDHERRPDFNDHMFM